MSTRDLQPARGRMLWRGLRRKCPRCGGGKLFHHWFTMIDQCPRCGLRFERTEGHWTGDLGINVMVSFGALLLTLLGGFLVSYPDPPGIGLLFAAFGVAILVPLLFFPVSKTIWLAIDLQFRPLAPDEVKEGFG